MAIVGFGLATGFATDKSDAAGQVARLALRIPSRPERRLGPCSRAIRHAADRPCVGARGAAPEGEAH
jgi:hypothetical protein